MKDSFDVFRLLKNFIKRCQNKDIKQRIYIEDVYFENISNNAILMGANIERWVDSYAESFQLLMLRRDPDKNQKIELLLQAACGEIEKQHSALNEL